MGSRQFDPAGRGKAERVPAQRTRPAGPAPRSRERPHAVPSPLVRSPAPWEEPHQR
jgi:hypothetical protein